MAVKRYRKRPVEIEAVLYDGTNFDEIFEWSDGGFRHVHPDLRKPGSDPEITAEVWDKLHSTWIGVKDGQYVLRGTLGEHYPHAAENFATSYESADAPPAPVLDLARVEAALRDVVSCMDYDLFKSYECHEEDGSDRFPELADLFAGVYETATVEA